MFQMMNQKKFLTSISVTMVGIWHGWKARQAFEATLQEAT
jgi:hypothetical protein